MDFNGVDLFIYSPCVVHYGYCQRDSSLAQRYFQCHAKRENDVKPLFQMLLK